jgi:WD40 repeat protein
MQKMIGWFIVLILTDIGGSLVNAQSDPNNRIVSALSWSLDGNQIAVASYEDYETTWGNVTLQIVDVNTSQVIRTLLYDPSNIPIIEFLAWRQLAHEIIAGNNANQLTRYDAQTGAVIATYQSTDNYMSSTSLDVGGTRISSIGLSGELDIRDLLTGQVTSTVSSAASNWIGWSPDGGKLATASQDGVVRIWDATTMNLLWALESPVLWRGWVYQNLEY